MVLKMPHDFYKFCKGRFWIMILFLMLHLNNGLVEGGGDSQQQSFRVRPSDTEAALHSDVLLRCEVDNQKGQAQWTQDGFAFGFNRTIPGFARFSVQGDPSAGVHNLRIRNVSLSDDGEFQCQVTPMLPSAAIRASAALSVIVPPSRVKLVGVESGASATKTVKEGESVSLQCVAKNAKPAPQIHWYRGDQLLVPAEVSQTDEEVSSADARLKNVKSTITVTPSHLDDGLVFRCRAQHPALPAARELSASLTLHVHYAPGNPDILGYVEGEIVRAGENRSLVCRSKGGNPEPQVFWYKNGERVDATFVMQHGFTTNKLEFTVDPTDNNAKYECHVHNAMTEAPKKSSVVMRVNFSPESVRITGPDQVNVGDRVSLSCSAVNSNPPADVSLLINDHPPAGLSSRRTKTAQGGFTTVSNVTDYEIGPMDTDVTVNCYAANQVLGTTKIDTKIITVLRPPSAPIILGYTEGTVLRKGDRRRLTCRSSGGNPLPDLKWYKGSKMLVTETIKDRGSSVSHLNIQLQMTDNGAEYRCEASNAATPSPLFNSTLLTVAYPPTGVKIEVSPSTPLAGQTATLSCTTTPAFPRANISWWRNGFQEEGFYGADSAGLHGGTISTYLMNVSVTAEMDKEIYTCQADNGFGSTTHDAVILNVHYKPVIELSKATVRVKEGEGVLVEASAKGNPPPESFSWVFAGAEVESGPTLNVSSVTKDMAGTYRLEVSNPVGTAAANLTLAVKYAPIITGVSGEAGVNAGSRVSLECVYDGGPKAEVEWKRKGFDMSRTETMSYEGKSVLYVSNVSASDSGFFECHVKNDVGAAVAPNASLVVNQKPEPDTSPSYKKAAADLGGSAELKCRMRASPKALFTWLTRDQEPIHTDIHPRYEVLPPQLVDGLYTYESVLLVRNVSVRDHGVFVCQARNSLGLVETRILLEGTSRPDAPIDPRVLNVSHDSILVAWTAGFDGGLAQRFRVRYKPLDSNNFLYADVYPGNASQFWVSNLRLSAVYEFSLVAINEKGESEYTREVVRGKTLSSAPLSDVEIAISRVLADKGGFPRVVTLAVSAVGAFLVLVNVALFLAVVYRRKRREKDAPGTSDKGSSKSTTLEMYAPSSYTGTVTAETLSSVSEKSRESYAHEDSTDDYEGEGSRANAASTYLIESLDPPPEYASRPPSHLVRPPSPLTDIAPRFHDSRRTMYTDSIEHVPVYGTLGRRGLPSSNSDHFNLRSPDVYAGVGVRHPPSFLGGPSVPGPHAHSPTRVLAYNGGSLHRNPPAHKLHFPSDYIRNGSTPVDPAPYAHQPRLSPARTHPQPALSTFAAAEVPDRPVLPLEQRGHLV